MSISLTEILSPFEGNRLIEWFSDLTQLWHNAAPVVSEDHDSPKGMTQWIHYNNFLLWHLEDDARRTDVPAEEIVKCKRAIDQHNQQRNDGIEKVDIWLDNVLKTSGIQPGDDVEINSETPGSIIDRMSILSLKIYHMREQSEREGVSEDHRKVARARLGVLEEQLRDLAKALDKLILDLRKANKRHKVYRQFKMYNDPNFNPAIYSSKKVIVQ